MKKLVLASAVSALFAVPAVTFAQSAPAAAPAAPPIPTLSQVLDASGVTVSGYVDVAYTRSNRNIETGFSDRAFDSQNNSFGLHQFGLTVAKQPKEGFGGLLNITMGKDAQALHSFPESNGTTSSMFDITQGYFQYATGPMTVIAGKFTTLQGTEVIASPSNVNISRSLLFFAVPLTHTGIRGTYAVSDTLSLILGVNNGWDQLTDSNRAKTVELGMTWNPVKPVTIALSDYVGKETVPLKTVGAPDGQRNSFDAVVSYNVIDPLTLGLEYLRVSQENFTTTPGNTIKATYSGWAGYVTYMFSPKWRGVLRAESLNDKDGLLFATPVSTSNKIKEFTATVSWLPADAYEMRAEIRRDTGDNAIFADFSTPTPGMSKSLLTYGIQGIYKF